MIPHYHVDRPQINECHHKVILVEKCLEVDGMGFEIGGEAAIVDGC